jgi:calcineurin-like phosphoesterase family protein
MLPGIYDAFQRWGTQTVWIYSDPHFGDKDLAEGVKNRPSDEEQIQMINSCVGRKDTLIILGDIGDIECVKKLRGYKVLIMGNHDAGKSNYTGVFNEVYEGALMVGEKLILSHEPVELPWAFNIHGHDHAGCQRPFHLNVCSDAIGYKPVNLNQFLKSGALSRIQTIHRSTIDRATQRKKKRGKKNERKN